MKTKIVSILVLMFFMLANVFAQNKSNRGKEFWLGYGFNYNFFHDNPNSQELTIYVSTIQAATVTVSINGTTWSQVLNIPANTVDASVLIPKSGINDARILTDGLSNRGIKISSNVDVAVYAHVYGTMVSGATMLMPVETYGYTYRSINYAQYTSGSNLPIQSNTTQNGPDWYSWFYVIAPEDNTRIEIIPADTTKNGWLPGQSYIVNLNKGETYSVFGKLINGNNQLWAASKDMTGSKITSVIGADGNCHPIALFSGSSGIRICRGDGGEFVHQQMFPLQAWGTRYLTYHSINNTNTDILETNRNYYRICVNDPTTIVKKNGITMTGLINNFYYDHMDSTGGDYFEANKPILVSQYTLNKNECWRGVNSNNVGSLSYGDPEMFFLSPIEQGQNNILFYTSRKANIDYVYTNIILPTNGVASLRVDGNPLPVSQIIPHPNLPSYSVALTRFIGPAAQHNIVSDSSFVAIVNGIGNWESYGYNAGCNIKNLNNFTQIKNTFNTSGNLDTFTCPKTPFRLFAKLAYPATSIHWKLSQAPGLFPNTDSIINAPMAIGTEVINGRTYYMYTLQQDFTFANAGTFTIPLSYTTPAVANCNQTEIAELTVFVKQGPIANFNFTNPVCLKDSVYFTGVNTTNGYNLNQYLWNFPDATTAATVNTVKKFSTPGTQNVRYRIFADNGCSGDTTKPITIFDSPKANFGISAYVICAKDSILITDTSTITVGTINSYQYIFGDGNTITRNNNIPFYYTYATTGIFTIKLIVQSNNNCKSDTAVRTITVNAKPIANFGYDRNICVNDSIRFTDTSFTATGSITNYRWNFGDGNTLVRTTNTPFYHTYTTAGNFVVSLVTINSNGCISDTAKRTVTVNAKPVTSITLIGKPCIDSTFSFTSTYPFTAAPPVRYHWNFGDGQIANSITTNNISHSYTSAASNIVVKNMVDLGGGCYSDTATITIPIINTNPSINFAIDKDTLCVGTVLAFTSTLTGAYIWQWNFGNGTGSNVPPFNRTYTTANNYTITAKVTDSNGCGSAILSDNLSIATNPQVNAGLDKFIQTGASVTLDASVTPAGSYTYLWSPATSINNATVLNPLATPTITTTYLLQAVNPLSNCIGEDAVTISVIDKLYIANVFTPNGDGKNDTWEILGLALYPNAVVTVYNRWGQKIIDTKNYYLQPWNGKYKNVELPNGAYIYFIQLNNTSKEIRKGTVMIIR